MLRLAKIILALILSASAPTPPQLLQTIYNGIVSDLTGTPVPSGNVTFTLRPGIDTTVSGNARFTPTAISCVIANPAVVSTSGTGTITVVVNPSQPWQVGDVLIFLGTADSGLNGSSALSPFVITGGSGTTFTFTLAGTHTNGAGGTVGGIFSPTGTGPCTVAQNVALNPAGTSYNVAIQPGGSTTSTFNTYAIGPGPIDISQIVPTPAQQPAYSFVDLFSNGQQISGQKSFTNTNNTYNGGTFNNPVLNNATFNTVTATNWLLVTPTIQAPIFTTQPITLSGTFNYSLSWANPAAARSISIPDPGGTDTFVFANMVQTLTNKTLGAGTILTVAPTTASGYPLVGQGFPIIIGQVSRTAVASALGPTQIGPSYTGATGAALVVFDYEIATRTSAGGAGVVNLILEWTDCTGNGSPTIVSANLVQTAFNVVSGSVTGCPTNGSNFYYYTNDATPSTATYDIYVKVRLE